MTSRWVVADECPGGLAAITDEADHPEDACLSRSPTSLLMPLITMSNTSRSIGTRSADNPADRPPTRQERDLPTTAADDYLTPIERRHGASLIKRLGNVSERGCLRSWTLNAGCIESRWRRVLKARRLYTTSLNEFSTLLLCDEGLIS